MNKTCNLQHDRKVFSSLFSRRHLLLFILIQHLYKSFWSPCRLENWQWRNPARTGTKMWDSSQTAFKAKLIIHENSFSVTAQKHLKRKTWVRTATQLISELRFWDFWDSDHMDTWCGTCLIPIRTYISFKSAKCQLEHLKMCLFHSLLSGSNHTGFPQVTCTGGAWGFVPSSAFVLLPPHGSHCAAGGPCLADVVALGNQLDTDTSVRAHAGHRSGDSSTINSI